MSMAVSWSESGFKGAGIEDGGFGEIGVENVRATREGVWGNEV
jgi:hypothetical protein